MPRWPGRPAGVAPTRPWSAAAPRRRSRTPCARRGPGRRAGAGGTVLAFGTTAPAADGLPTYQWYFKELTILNPRAARPRDCDAAIRLAASGRLELAPLITARFPLAQASRALAACAAPGQLKVMLDVT